MKILYFLNIFLIFSLEAVTICPLHNDEIKSIRSNAREDLIEASYLTGDASVSIAYSTYDMARDAVKDNKTYSDFVKTFRHCINNCNKKGKLCSSNRLYLGLNKISNSFLTLYNNCIINHHNYQSVFERGKIHFDRGNIELCINDIEDLINSKIASELIKDIKPSDLLLTKGQAFLEMGDYENAIKALTDVIEKDPNNKEAHFHRAAAFFEVGDFNKSLKDYLKSDKGKTSFNSTAEASQDFSQELIKGVCQGSLESAAEFVPSMCNSVYGIGETLWSFSQTPVESTKNFANACLEIGECISDYYKEHDLDNIVEDCSQEIKSLYEKYDQLNDKEKGKIIGYTIGKYGVDIFAGGALFKGIAAYRHLRNANIKYNLEVMATSSVKKEVIISSALKHNAKRETFFKNAKINWDKQNKHIPGKNNYKTGKSTILIETTELEQLVKIKAGKGQKIVGEVGNAGYKERVDFGKVIGEFAQRIDEEQIIYLPTKNGIITYAKDGTVHVIPSHPGGK